MLALVLLVGCNGKPASQDSGGDTGGAVAVACAQQPCVTDVAAAQWAGAETTQFAASSLAAWGDTVVVGSVGETYAGVDCSAAALRLPDLAQTATWPCEMYFALGGAAIAIGDPDGDGAPIVAVGQAGDWEWHTRVFVLDAAATGSLADAASLVVTAGPQDKLATDLVFAAVGAGDDALLVMGAVGGIGIADGALYAVDPAVTGEVAAASLDLALRGGPGFGGEFAAVDLDGDGQLDLAVTASMYGGVALFPGPWTGVGSEDDALGVWTNTDTQSGLGEVVEPVGDVTGDGVDDFAFSAATWGTDPFRTGRVYVVAGSTTGLGFGPVDDVPIQVHGGFLGEGAGFGIAGADVTGDGTTDLVVGASGVPPGRSPGAVLVFPGPVSGISQTEDAPYQVHGENDFDLFGRAMAVVDADGDARDDLVVGAHWWPAGEGRGAVYLLLGADIAP